MKNVYISLGLISTVILFGLLSDSLIPDVAKPEAFFGYMLVIVTLFIAYNNETLQSRILHSNRRYEAYTNFINAQNRLITDEISRYHQAAELRRFRNAFNENINRNLLLMFPDIKQSNNYLALINKSNSIEERLRKLPNQQINPADNIFKHELSEMERLYFDFLHKILNDC